MLTGIALIVSVAHLFFTGGDNPYSRERVGDYLSYLIIPSVITVVAVIAGIAYDAITKEKNGDGFKRSEGEMLEGYSKRFDVNALAEETKTAVLGERQLRNKANIICHAVSAFFGIFAIIYLAFFAEYSVEALNGDVISALSSTLPLLTAAFAAEILRTVIFERSAARERKALLEAVKAGYPIAPAKGEEISEKEKKTESIVRYAVLAISAILIVLGILNGGMGDVLAKAVKICTECIGLG